LQENKQELENSNLHSDSLKIQNDNGELDTTLPVEKLELGKLARRCFEELNIHTIGDLLQHSEIDLLKTKYAGHFFIQRIKNKLEEYNIALTEYSLNELNTLPIDKLELESAGSELKEGDIYTIGDLLQYSEEELLATKKISYEFELEEIRNRLKEYGLSLTVY